MEDSIVISLATGLLNGLLLRQNILRNAPWMITPHWTWRNHQKSGPRETHKSCAIYFPGGISISNQHGSSHAVLSQYWWIRFILIHPIFWKLAFSKTRWICPSWSNRFVNIELVTWICFFVCFCLYFLAWDPTAFGIGKGFEVVESIMLFLNWKMTSPKTVDHHGIWILC